MSVALRLIGDVDPDALEEALADVVARHESLRTVYPEENDVPQQRILPAEQARPTLAIEEIAESQLEQRLATAAATPIDLGRETPLKAWLFRLATPQNPPHVLVLSR